MELDADLLSSCTVEPVVTMELRHLRCDSRGCGFTSDRQLNWLFFGQIRTVTSGAFSQVVRDLHHDLELTFEQGN